MELARVETWIESGSTVTPFYDPMIAKIIVTGKDRTEALEKLDVALEASAIDGTETNLRYLRKVAASAEFVAGKVTTSFLGGFQFDRNTIEVLEGGTQTTIQDYPGRIGYWNIGVPPSGPMDHLSFRIANRLVGNAETAAGIEFATMGGRLRFHTDALIALTGADMSAKLNGKPVERWTTMEVKAGSVLSLGAASSAGRVPIWRCAAGSIRSPTWAAVRRSCSEASVATRAVRFVRAMCCTLVRKRRVCGRLRSCQRSMCRR